ncbi:hypothetical protein OAT67_09865 [Bacteriovoracaceae bacterium]|nr:hypothetical protein [Bacteriovoracaceae bacterium]
MKTMFKMFILLTIFNYSNSLYAMESLDALFERQETVTVSPVEIEGVEIASGREQREGWRSASVCKSLGYSRLVSFSTTKARISKFYKVLNRNGVVIFTLIVGNGSSNREIIKSVVCAR